MKFTSLCLVLALALGSVTATAQAAEHLIPAEEIHSALAIRTVQREAHIADVQALLRHESVRSRVGDLTKVEALIANLDDQTLSDLGARSRQVNTALAAEGSGTWIAVGVAAAIGITVAILLAVRLGNE